MHACVRASQLGIAVSFCWRRTTHASLREQTDRLGRQVMLARLTVDHWAPAPQGVGCCLAAENTGLPPSRQSTSMPQSFPAHRLGHSNINTITITTTTAIVMAAPPTPIDPPPTCVASAYRVQQHAATGDHGGGHSHSSPTPSHSDWLSGGSIRHGATGLPGSVAVHTRPHAASHPPST